jgi:hypothetical protein
LVINGEVIRSGHGNWSVVATGQSKATSRLIDPTIDTMAVQIQFANAEGAWEAPAVGDRNDESIWALNDLTGNGELEGPMPGIELDSRWMWFDSGVSASPWAPFYPGADHGEFLIFRLQMLDRPEEDG